MTLVGPWASVTCRSPQCYMLSSSCMPTLGVACRGAILLACSHAEAPISAAEVQQPVVRPDARQLQRLSGASLGAASFPVQLQEPVSLAVQWCLLWRWSGSSHGSLRVGV